MRSICFLFILFFSLTANAILAQIVPSCKVACGQGDLTAQIEILGNIPVQEGMTSRARNIWDLQRYQDRIYIGYGNTTTNPGPIKLYSIDQEKVYHYETNIRAEAIEKFRVINGRLVVPNSDPLGGQSDMLKLSDRDQSGNWADYSWTPSLAHTRDIIPYQDSLYMIGNSWGPKNKTAAFSSLHITDEDYGQVYTSSLLSELSTVDPLENGEWNWFFGGFSYQDTLILPNAILTKEYRPDRTVQHAMCYIRTGNTTRWSATLPASERILHEHLYPVDMNISDPDYPQSYIIAWPFAAADFNDRLLIAYRSYSLEDPLYLDAYSNTAGMVIKHHLRDRATFVSFPDSDAVGEDILVQGDELFVLAHAQTSAFQFTNYVYKTKTLGKSPSDWTEVMRFTSSNIARSFELMDGYFYFGLGANFGDQIANCGQLLRIATECDNSNCSLIGQTCDDQDVCTTNDQYDTNCNCTGTYQDSDGDGICDAADCPTSAVIPGIVHSVITKFDASDWIRSDARIQSYLNIQYVAGQEISLEPGFETVPQMDFHARIGPCR